MVYAVLNLFLNTVDRQRTPLPSLSWLHFRIYINGHTNAIFNGTSRLITCSYNGYFQQQYKC